MFSFTPQIAIALLVLSGNSLALADTSDTASTGVSSDQGSMAAASSVNGSISGRVEHRTLSGQTANQQPVNLKQTDETIRHSLKNVADSAHHLQHTVHSIIYEITREEFVTVAEPNVIGPMVIPAMGPNPFIVGDYLPPRKKYMDLFAGQVQSLLGMLIEEGSSLPDTKENDPQLSAKLVEIKKDLDNLNKQNGLLQTLMAGPSYDNLKIGRQALLISDELDSLKKMLKESEQRIGNDVKHDPE